MTFSTARRDGRAKLRTLAPSAQQGFPFSRFDAGAVGRNNVVALFVGSRANLTDRACLPDSLLIWRGLFSPCRRRGESWSALGRFGVLGRPGRPQGPSASPPRAQALVKPDFPDSRPPGQGIDPDRKLHAQEPPLSFAGRRIFLCREIPFAYDSNASESYGWKLSDKSLVNEVI